MKVYSIAIDGPAGAGKSSVAKAIAKELEFIYIDTGAMYRAIGLKALNKGFDTSLDKEKITNMTDNTEIDIKYIEGILNIFTDGENVTDLIRTNEVSLAASNVSAIPDVRLKLVEIQRNLAKSKSSVMDGRDIGTYVLPDADIKIYLTASIDERAKRRYNELIEKGVKCDFEQLKSEIALRDKQDMEREFAPLKQAEDAILVDTSEMTLEQSISFVLNLIKEKLF